MLLAGAAALVTLALLPAAASAAPSLYVNLGDSYATGFQRIGPDGVGRSTRQGYADQLVRLLPARGLRRLRLVNFGCGGATSRSLNRARGCRPAIARTVGGPRYEGRTQLQAAERFLRRNRGDVGLVTIAIGGNDFTPCAGEGDAAAACVLRGVEAIRRELPVTLRRLRAAAGPRVPVVGITYPNVLLAEVVRGNQALADLATVAFRDVINPAYRTLYRAAGARFVDVTEGFGAYLPFAQTTTLAPYGTIPVAVARICELTYACGRLRDIHATTAGYREVARLIARALPRR